MSDRNAVEFNENQSRNQRNQPPVYQQQDYTGQAGHPEVPSSYHLQPQRGAQPYQQRQHHQQPIRDSHGAGARRPNEMYRHSGGASAASSSTSAAASSSAGSSGIVSSKRADNDSKGGGERRFLNAANNVRCTEPDKHAQFLNKGDPKLFLFDRTNQNPTQSQVDEFFRQKPALTSYEIINIFLRAVQWKKKKRIDVLGGEKLSLVVKNIWHLIPTLNGKQLTKTAMATINGLQAIASTNTYMSGEWVVMSNLASLL